MMKPHKLLIPWVASMMAMAVWATYSRPSSALFAQDSSPQSKRSEFMRLKLDYAKNVLEGLALERLDLVATNARLLKEMSAAAQWEVASVPGMEYNNYTSEFQRIADDLSKQAKAKNLDGATLGYVRLTMNCVNCHKYVRDATQ